jgi:hypothetical protein
MDVENEIIPRLDSLGVLKEQPPEKHPAYRMRSEYGTIDPILVNERELFETDNKAKSSSRFLPNIEDNFYIPNGDIAFPEEVSLPDLDKEVVIDGVECIAWYCPFHYYRRDWGIYILDRGIYYIAGKILEKKPEEVVRSSFNLLDLLRLGFRFLLLHEFFHFMTEIAGSAIEVSNENNPKDYYAKYVQDVYLQPSQDDEPLEEALANAFSLQRLRGSGIYQEIRDMLLLQPRGYSHFGEYLRIQNNGIGRRRLATTIQNGSSQASGPSFLCGEMAPLEILFDYGLKDYSAEDVPIRVVPVIANVNYALRCIPKEKILGVVETERVKKALSGKNLNKECKKRWSSTKRFLEAGEPTSARLATINKNDSLYSADAGMGNRAIILIRDGKNRQGSYYCVFEICDHDKYEKKYQNQKINPQELDRINQEVDAILPD